MGCCGSSRKSWVVPLVCIIYYYISSLSIINFNKWFFVVMDVHFPLLITFGHQMVVSLCSFLYLKWERYPHVTMCSPTFRKYHLPLGLAIGIDIAVTNVSFLYLEVSFIEMVKATSPVWVMIMALILGNERFSKFLVVVISVISGGLVVASYGEARFNVYGFGLCMTAAVLVGVRLNLMQYLLQRKQQETTALPTSENAEVSGQSSARRSLAGVCELLYLTSPVSGFVMLVPGLIWEAKEAAASKAMLPQNLFHTLGLCLFGSFLALNLLISETALVQQTSAMTTVVVGIAKIVLVILTSVALFGNTITPLNAGGFAVCMVGIVAYQVHRVRNPSRLTSEEDFGDEELEEAEAFLVSSSDDDLAELDDNDIDELTGMVASQTDST